MEDKGKEKKQSKGRRKIEIKKIDDDSHRLVTFSKRRAGLFKQAREMSVLCGAESAIIVVSPKNRVYTFGQPDVDSVVDRYVRFSQCEKSEPEGSDSDAKNKCLEEFKVVGEKRDDTFWWKTDIEKMGLEELEEFLEALEGLKKMVQMKVGENDEARS